MIFLHLWSLSLPYSSVVPHLHSHFTSPTSQPLSSPLSLYHILHHHHTHFCVISHRVTRITIGRGRGRPMGDPNDPKRTKRETPIDPIRAEEASKDWDKYSPTIMIPAKYRIKHKAKLNITVPRWKDPIPRQPTLEPCLTLHINTTVVKASTRWMDPRFTSEARFAAHSMALWAMNRYSQCRFRRRLPRTSTTVE
ncbi:hypothetical protein BDV59DRAFT_9604 [Aspergillus ambiguus]|uniref:uncharacterized protein n=1 Tax=Aspergillus ambiguus TaxID=176160 RepID=UPI003CCD73B9